MSDAAALDAIAARALQRLRAADPRLAQALDRPEAAARVARVAVASKFAVATFVRQPDVLLALLEDGAAPAAPVLDAGNRADWGALLRRHRAAMSARLAWRDVLGLDDVDATLAGSTALADDCLRIALAALEAEFAGRHGHVRGRDGAPQRLVVFALGKLGGGELNFSSDVDLVY